jgi:ribonuclease P protein component
MAFLSECPPKTAGLSLREGAQREGSDWQLLSLPNSRSLSQQGFPKAERLLKRKDFLSLAGSRARKIQTQHFIVLRGEAKGPSARIGITASRKTGNAVVRNRSKRLIREFYRLNKSLFLAADYNIIAKPGAARLEYTVLVQELTRALQRLG